MNKTEIKNWKLKEVIDHVEIVAMGASVFIEKKLIELNVPRRYNQHFHRGETFIDWHRMSVCNEFFFDYEGWEDKIKKWFEQSKLGEAQSMVITYLQEETVVKIPVKVFFEDWEGFVRSTLYNGLFFSEDYKLIMEVSRDYYLRSNFKIYDG